MTTNNFSFIKGGVCYHWSLFFFNLFTKIDKNNKLSKKLVIFNPTYNHGVFQIGFKNKKFIIDPYAKDNGLITEVKEGNKLYLSALAGESIYGKIIDTNNLKLQVGKINFNANIFNNQNDFINNIKNSNELINIKTYIQGKPIHIIIKDSDSKIIINYKGEMFSRDKEFLLIDLVGLYIKGKKVKK